MIEVIEGVICSPSEYDDNLKVDFSGLVKKKGSIDYLPWGEIVRTLHKAVPGCTYGFKSSPDGSIVHYTPDRNGYLRPYLIRRFHNATTGACELIVESPAGFFPISNMAARHKAIEDPDIRAIDNCLRRAVAKEIGIHTGLGLSLWASSDPYDLVDEDEEASSSPAPGPSRVMARGRVVTKAGATEPDKGKKVSSSSKDSLVEKLNETANRVSLTNHGKATVAVAVKADSWDEIPTDKIPRIMTLLASADYVKLFNAGRNSSGKEINPRDNAAETMEIVEAFKQAKTAADE